MRGRRDTVGLVVVGLLIGLAMWLIVSALCRMATASADTAWVWQNGPAVCDALDGDPTTAGVDRLLLRMVAAGMTPEAIGTGIAGSVWQACPQHIELIDRYLAEYAGVPT